MPRGVIIGASHPSMPGYNTLLFAPALIATKDDLDQVVGAVGKALGRVVG